MVDMVAGDTGGAVYTTRIEVNTTLFNHLIHNNMATEKKSFWQKLLTWVGCFKIVEIIDYVKTEFAEADAAVKTKSTAAILSYIFDLLKEVLAAWRAVQAVETVSTKASTTASAKAAKTAKITVKNEVLKQIVK